MPKILRVVIFVLLLVACTPTPGPTPTLTVDPGTPTASPTVAPPTATLTETPTHTPRPTETVSPLPTPVSPLPTPTVLLPATGTLSQDVPVIELSGTRLAAIIAMLTSLLLAYIPGFQQWWEKFPYKRELLAGVGFIVAWLLVGLHYAGALDLGLGVFGWPVIWKVIETWLAFAGAGQLTFTAQKLK